MTLRLLIHVLIPNKHLERKEIVLYICHTTIIQKSPDINAKGSFLPNMILKITGLIYKKNLRGTEIYYVSVGVWVYGILVYKGGGRGLHNTAPAAARLRGYPL
jgi:hypothetical protein